MLIFRKNGKIKKIPFLMIILLNELINYLNQIWSRLKISKKINFVSILYRNKIRFWILKIIKGLGKIH